MGGARNLPVRARALQIVYNPQDFVGYPPAIHMAKRYQRPWRGPYRSDQRWRLRWYQRTAPWWLTVPLLGWVVYRVVFG